MDPLKPVPVTTAKFPLKHGRLEVIAWNTDVLRLQVQEDLPLVDFVGMGDAEYRFRFTYSPPDDRPEVLLAEVTFPFTVDVVLCTGELASSSYDVSLFNSQTEVFLNAIQEMNALVDLHWNEESSDPPDRAAPIGPLSPRVLGEFFGGLLRGFSGVG